MKNTKNKYAFFTILDNKFVKNFLFSLWSLKKFNNLNNIDLYVFSKENITETNKKKIQKIYSSVFFKEVSKSLITHKWPFDYDLKLQAYKLKDYTKIVYFDADVLFFKNFTNILKFKCNFGAVNYGNYFSATILVFSIKEATSKNLNKFLRIFNSNKSAVHDQEIFNIMYKNYFKIPYEYNQIFTDFNINTVKCLQFPGQVKGLDKNMEKLLLTKNSAPLTTKIKSYIVFKKIKKQFLKEVNLSV
jgi:hypothetical protein